MSAPHEPRESVDRRARAARLLGEELVEGEPASGAAESLCTRHEELAPELRELGVWLDGMTLTDEGTLKRLERSLGFEVDPSVDLRPDLEGEDAQGSAELEPELEDGRDAGRYEERGEIGRGGMGTVFRVWDRDLRRELAMKVLRGKRFPDRIGASSAALRRFLEEAQITGQLEHPGVVAVHELGLDRSGQIYFTMPLVRGQRLVDVFRLVRDGSEEWNRHRALDALLRACEAVAFAHAHGVIHRDLKPENVMVGRFGEVQVMDWGLAKVLDRAESATLHTPVGEAEHTTARTLAGTVIGTPAYMPPEQAEGQLDDVGTAADVYAAGAMLYQLLAGHPPYVPPDGKAAPRRVLLAVLAGPPTPLHKTAPGTPPELAAICERAMARDPQARYPSMAELRDDLRAYLENRVVRAYKTGALAEFRSWVRRNFAFASALAATLLAVVGGLLAVWRVSAVKNQELTLSNAEARSSSYRANLVAAESHLRLREHASARSLLEVCPEEHRAWEWHQLLRRTRGGTLRVRDDLGAAVMAADYSPDGRYVLFGCFDGNVRLWDRESDELIELSQSPGQAVSAVAWSPDGVHFAAGGGWLVLDEDRDCDVRVWDVRDLSQPAARLSLGTQLTRALAWSPDGATLAVANGASVRLWDWRADDAQRLEEHMVDVRALAFDSSGRFLASAGGRRDSETLDLRILVWHVPSGMLEGVIEGHGEVVHSLAFLSDSHELVAGTDSGQLWRASAEGGAPQRIMRSHDGAVRDLAFASDGRLLSAGIDRRVIVWDQELEEPQHELTGPEVGLTALAVHPQGLEVVAGGLGGAAHVWELPAAQGFPSLSGWARGALALTADGSLLASDVGDARVCLWDTRSGLPHAVYKLGVEEGRIVTLAACAIDRDGRLLVAGLRNVRADLSLHIWDLERGELVRTLAGFGTRLYDAEFAPEGDRFATSDQHGGVKLWQAPSGDPLVEFGMAQGQVLRLRFHPHRNELACVLASGEVQLWDLEQPSEPRTLCEGAGRDLCFDAEGQSLLVGSSDAAQQPRILSLLDGSALELAGHPGAVTAVGFTPDGRRALTACVDGSMRIYDRSTGEQLLSLGLPRGVPNDVVFSEDGHFAAVSTVTGLASYSLAEGSEDVRAERVLLASVWRELAPLVEEHITPTSIRRALGRPDAWSEAQHDMAQLVIELVGQTNADELNRKAWSLASQRGLPTASYRPALLLAEAAHELEPDDVRITNTLGLVYLRLEQYEDAIETLEYAEQQEPLLPNVVYLVLAHYGLGQLAEAHAIMAEVRARYEDTEREGERWDEEAINELALTWPEVAEGLLVD